MATKKKMLQAAAGNASGGGEPGLNVEDVFSTYLYEGNSSSQVIENGINLGQSFGSGSARLIVRPTALPIQISLRAPAIAGTPARRRPANASFRPLRS